MTELARMRLFAGALAVAAGAACFRGSLPPLEKYRLALPDPARDQADSGPVTLPASRLLLEGSLAIAPYRTPGMYGDASIVYRIGEHQYGAYPNREWAMPLSIMLGHITERVLEARPLSLERALYAPPTRLSHPYEWQGIVREFEEVNRDRQVLVSVALEVRLVRTADEAVVWQGSAEIERQVADPTMSAIVEALSASAAEVVTTLAAEARAALERSPPPTAGR